ncbi:rhodanese-like domain-containing protein [Desulfobulbus alkaliphilus]|nr:rhodanese-like domain-containing protein [Desulfobulbus alkaliphilus]
MKSMKRLLLWTLAINLFFVASLSAATVGLMDKDTLLEQLDAENLVILDARQGRDWTASTFKIKGAVRFEGRDFSVVDAYPPETTLVLYCA